MHNAAQRAVVERWEGHSKGINCVASGPGDRCAAFTGSRDLSLRAWRRGSRDAVLTLQGHTLTVTAVAWHGPSATLLSGSRDTTVRAWDVATGVETERGRLSRNLVTCLATLPPTAGPVVAQGSEDLTLRLWDLRTMSVVQDVGRRYTYFPLCVAAVDDGHSLVTGSNGFQGGQGCELRLLDLRRDGVVAEHTAHSQAVTAVGVLPAGEAPSAISVASASKDGTVAITSFEGTPRTVQTLTPAVPGQVTGLAVVAADAASASREGAPFRGEVAAALDPGWHVVAGTVAGSVHVFEPVRRQTGAPLREVWHTAEATGAAREPAFPRF